MVGNLKSLKYRPMKWKKPLTFNLCMSLDCVRALSDRAQCRAVLFIYFLAVLVNVWTEHQWWFMRIN